MCGIAGFVTRRKRGISRTQVAQAIDLLEHRGPDDAGFLCVSRQAEYAGRDLSRHLDESWLTLVHRRLSILDLSEAGWQPMSSADGRWHIVYNGEVYNHVELRNELESLGYQFRSHSDTEVLLNALIAWGTDALRRLTGMFAFALFDQRDNRLLLARDCFGIKPLFYTSTDDDFNFASEIKVLLKTTAVSRQVQADRLMWYLRYGITDHGDRTMFEHIRQLPPAHYLSVDLKTLRIEEPVRYWKPETTETLDVSFDEAVGTVRDMFLNNIELHLRSDVQVGMALSGGIDSSAVVMSARKILGREAELHTFSYIASDARLSEERWVDVVNEASAATVHKVS
ncbi:MAG: asparagine synthase (glutamine-hydrolyzing), partial [Planctomycetaceae bacterium]|nr:asparagine synthase (glutamine-hydrolyzing) [Planctomycetaceae bacterium]